MASGIFVNRLVAERLEIAALFGVGQGVAIQVRDKEANIDNLVNPIEDMYALLLRYAVAVPKEESDLVSDLHYSWKKLRKLATDVSNKLAHLQAGFKRELIKQVNVFVVEARSFKCVFYFLLQAFHIQLACNCVELIGLAQTCKLLCLEMYCDWDHLQIP